MIQYKKLLLPIDISEPSVEIIPHIKTLAASFDAEVHLLYVARANEYYVEDESEPGEGITRRVRAFAETHCKAIPRTKVAVKDGEVAIEILSYIERECIDMAIMAIKGKTALGKAVFGSTAGQVARAAGVPVVLINPLDDKFIG